MASLAERIKGRLIDIQSQIDRIEAEAADRIARLEAEKEKLVAMSDLLTPKIEAATAELVKMGVISI
jgi:hypothetical protein